MMSRVTIVYAIEHVAENKQSLMFEWVLISIQRALHKDGEISSAVVSQLTTKGRDSVIGYAIKHVRNQSVDA